MVRARMAGVALAAALGLACGCSTPSGCSDCGGSSLTSRLTGLFRHNRGTPVEVVGSPVDGPVIADPGLGSCDGPGCAPEPPAFAPPPPAFAPPPPQSFAPPLAPLPPLNEAQRMPYQP